MMTLPSWIVVAMRRTGGTEFKLALLMIVINTKNRKKQRMTKRVRVRVRVIVRMSMRITYFMSVTVPLS